MVSNLSPSQNDLNRLMAAAVIDRDFCKLLLSNPVRAIGQGYCGERFQLPPETQAQLGSINATSLSEFAQKLSLYPINGDFTDRSKKFVSNGKLRLTHKSRQIYDSYV